MIYLFEVLVGTLQTNLPQALAYSVSAGVLRNVLGYAENVFADGIVTQYEVKQMFGTVVKYFGFIMLLSFGMDIGSATALTFGIDVSKNIITKK